MFHIKRTVRLILLLTLSVMLFACEQHKESKKSEPVKAEANEKKSTSRRKPKKNLKKAPSFTLISVNGGDSVSLSDYAGKVVLIDFWTTWCPPCKISIPNLKILYDKYHDDGLEVIGVSVDRVASIKDELKVQKFVKDYDMEYPVVYSTGRMRSLYGGITTVPTFFIIDREGMIYASYFGYSRALEKEMEEIVKELL